MKKLLLISLCFTFLILSTLCIAQTSYLTLSASKDAPIREYNGVGDGNNYGAAPFLNMQAWTNGGIAANQRSLIDFNLSIIPTNATIQSAFLFLYVDMNLNTFPGGHQQLSGSNESIIKRVTNNWNENLVTWNIQPSTITLNQTIIPQSIASNQNYIIDVTNLVQDMINDTLNSFGFFIKLINESYYRRMIFASKENPNEELHPKLGITYIADTTLAFDCTDSLEVTDVIIDNTNLTMDIAIYNGYNYFLNYPYVAFTIDANGDTIQYGNINLFGAINLDTAWYNYSISSAIIPAYPLTMYFVYSDESLVTDTCVLTYSSIPTNITYIKASGNRKLIRIIDVLGKKNKGTRNEPLFYIYDDGTVEKRITID